MKLYLAEKRGVGVALANALARFTGEEAKNGKDNSINGRSWRVTWLAGHAYGLFDVKDYKAWPARWDEMKLPVIPERFKYKPIDMEHLAKLRASLERHLQNATSVVIATDPGQEGQIIAEIALKQLGWTGPTERFWCSSMDLQPMINALGSLKPNSDYRGLASAGIARQESDWLIGINFSIALTNLARKAGYDTMVSAGRVQSVLLSIVVQRELEIEQFEPKSYLSLKALLANEDGESVTAAIQVDAAFCDADGRCTNEAEAKRLLDGMSENATVTRLNSTKQSHATPEPYTLTRLAIDVCSRMDVTAEQVQEAYQELYMNKHLTYPRTADAYYEDELYDQAPEILGKVKRQFPELAAMIDVSTA